MALFSFADIVTNRRITGSETARIFGRKQWQVSQTAPQSVPAGVALRKNGFSDDY